MSAESARDADMRSGDASTESSSKIDTPYNHEWWEEEIERSSGKEKRPKDDSPDSAYGVPPSSPVGKQWQHSVKKRMRKLQMDVMETIRRDLAKDDSEHNLDRRLCVLEYAEERRREREAVQTAKLPEGRYGWRYCLLEKELLDVRERLAMVENREADRRKLEKEYEGEKCLRECRDRERSHG